MKLSLVLLGLIASTVIAVPIKNQVDEKVDGRTNPIAQAIAHLLIGLCPDETVKDLLNTILEALNTPEIDYWGEVEDEVTKMVGEYINEHNIHQVEIYQKDLQTLMDRYNNAPVITNTTYPNKNQQALDLSTSIILHRYLVEAALLPQSMILHFADISSIHIIVLKDVAETYSFPGAKPSKWWLDLNEELQHYIEYGEYLSQTLITWRTGMVTCDSHASGKYEIYEGTDGVTGEKSSCKELKGTKTCEKHCENFFTHKKLDVDKFLSIKMDTVLEAWHELKNTTSIIIGDVSDYYDPREEL